MRVRPYLALGVVLAATAAWTAPALAQGADPPPAVTLQLKDADVRGAVDMLFRETGFSYVLTSAVQGRVTVDLHDVSWDQALRYVLDSLNLTYRREDNVYTIDRRGPVTPPPPRLRPEDSDRARAVAPTGGERLEIIKVRYNDPAMIAAVFGGTSIGYLYGGGGLNTYGVGTYGQPGVGTLRQPGVGVFGQSGVGTQPFGTLGPGAGVIGIQSGLGTTGISGMGF